jgi:hypothetical protein
VARLVLAVPALPIALWVAGALVHSLSKALLAGQVWQTLDFREDLHSR